MKKRELKQAIKAFAEYSEMLECKLSEEQCRCDILQLKLRSSGNGGRLRVKSTTRNQYGWAYPYHDGQRRVYDVCWDGSAHLHAISTLSDVVDIVEEFDDDLTKS